MKLDKVGYWSEIKLEIIKEYASAYTIILSQNRNAVSRFCYIDAFAGAGIHISKDRDEFIAGSPLKVLTLEPHFDEYHLIDIDKEKTNNLEKIRDSFKNKGDIFIYNGDCNGILLIKIFPRCEYPDHHRALCILDPYG